MNNKTPKLRFKGFTDAWEQRKLGEVLSFLKDGTHGTHADANDGPLLLSAKNIKDGAIKWDASDRRISREEYERIHAKFSLMPGDVLLTIVGSIGETAILKDVEGLTFQRSVAFLRPNNEISSEFLYSEIQTPAFQKELDSRKSTSAQPGIYLGDLAEIPINYSPSLEEQKKIGEYFRHLDNLITLHQRKLDKLNSLKKGYLEKIFPKEGKLYPELRFTGFTDAWEQRKLGDLVERITRKNANLESNLPLTISAQYGLIDQNEYFDKRIASKDVSGYYLIKKGEFAYNKSTSSDAEWGAIKRLDRYEKGVLSTLYIVFKIINEEKLSSDFLVSYYETNLWHKGIQSIAAEGARNHGLLNIAPKDFFETSLTVPSNFVEQQKIGSFFKSLDNLITLHQRKLEKLKQLKTSYLNSMFI